MNRGMRLMNYVFVALCTAGLMFPILSFINSDKTSEINSGQMKTLADTTVMITFVPLGMADPASGKFEPGAQADTAIATFVNLWSDAPSGNIVINKSNMTKSDLFSISALDSLLQISNTSREKAKYLTIIKGIDPASGNLKSFLALVDKDLNIIRESPNRTYLQDGIRCPDLCPE